MGLKSKLIAAAGSLIIAFSTIPAINAYAAGSYTQTNVFITYDGQIVDTFMGVPAKYATFYAWSGPYSCATYAADFYSKHFGVTLYDINSYKGRPHIYAPGHTAELRDVTQPIPGDLVQALDYSHVAIVKEVNGDEITLIEQNWKWNDYSTGKPICTVNRKVGLKDNYYYRLYLDGIEQRLPQYQQSSGGGSQEQPSPVYTEPSVTAVSASSITCSGFTVSAAASGTSLSSFRFGTYLKSKGSSTAKWTTSSASGNTAYASANISVSDFGNEGGTYVTVVEITDSTGKKSTKSIETLVDRTPPTIENVTVTNNTSDGYTVSCSVKDGSGVSAVFFPSWTTASGKDDLPADWAVNGNYSAPVSNGKAEFTVKSADHNREYGEYNTDICVYDSFGNQTVKSIKVNVEPEKILTISDETLRIESGRSILLGFNVTDAAGSSFDEKAVWTTSDSSVAKVYDGVVYAVHPGKAVVTASAAGKSITCSVTVTESLDHLNVNTISNIIEEGKMVAPSPIISDGTKTLVKNCDYTLMYTNNHTDGTATVTIIGIGDYSGTKTILYNVTAKPVPSVQETEDIPEEDSITIISGFQRTFARIISVQCLQTSVAGAYASGNTVSAAAIANAFSDPMTSPVRSPKLTNSFSQLTSLSISTYPRAPILGITSSPVLHAPIAESIKTIRLLPLTI